MPLDSGGKEGNRSQGVRAQPGREEGTGLERLMQFQPGVESTVLLHRGGQDQG